MRRLHLISGLPRSGSTLLAGILRQNPRFSAAMTGPAGSLVTTLLNAMSPQNETAVFLDEACQSALNPAPRSASKFDPPFGEERDPARRSGAGGGDGPGPAPVRR